MPDQSLLNDEQDRMLFVLTTRWNAAQAARLSDADTLTAAANAAGDALRGGGEWPEDAWVENILMIGANSCAAAVLNHGRYEELEDVCSALYQEVLDRRWLHGGPSGLLEASEVEGLSRAVGQWQVNQAPTAPQARGGIADSPKRKRWFRG